MAQTETGAHQGDASPSGELGEWRREGGCWSLVGVCREGSPGGWQGKEWPQETGNSWRNPRKFSSTVYKSDLLILTDLLISYAKFLLFPIIVYKVYRSKDKVDHVCF